MINSDEELALEYLLSPEFEMINSAGKPLTDGWIECYLHGTRDKYYCYSDWAGTLHPFQIPLDSLGSNIVLADPNNCYDVYFYNKYGSLIMSRYNVKCQGSGSGGAAPYIGDRLEYGQYTASNVLDVATLNRTQGNIATTVDGKIKLKEDMSYHITVRGSYVIADPLNTETTLNFIEPTTLNRIKINVDNTITDPQYFELSYDLFKLQYDTDYAIAFDSNNGKVDQLTVEVHSLSNLNTTLTGGQLFEQGWGILIEDNVISVDPTIFNDYVTWNDLASAVSSVHEIVTQETVELVSSVSSVLQSEIDNIQEGVQADWAQEDESEPDYIKNKPDLSVYATHDEVIEVVTAVSTVLQNEIDQIPPQAQVDWEEDDVDSVRYIRNKPDLDIYATNETVTSVSSTLVEMIDEVSANIPELPETEEVEFEELDVDNLATKDDISDLNGVITAVSSTLHTEIVNEHESMIETVTAVSSVLQDEIDNIHIPDYQGGEYVVIENETISVTGLQPEGDYATRDELASAINEVSAAIPELPETEEVEFEELDVDSLATKDDVITAVTSVSSVLQNEIDNIHIPDYQGGEYVVIENETISVTGLQPEGDYATREELATAVSAVSAAIPELPETEEVEFEELDVDSLATKAEVNAVSGDLYNLVTSVSAAVPDAQVQSDWTETDDTKKSYIQHKPEVQDIYAGAHITLTETASGIEIASDGTDTDAVSAIAEAYMEIATAMIPEAQVQSDWTEDDNTKKSYIQNKPTPKKLTAGPGIEITDTVTGVEIAAAVTAIEGYVTEEEFIEVVSAVTGTGDYGQFYCTEASGACVMGKIKGTIDVTNDGKIKLEKGKSYHISVRGCYKQSTVSNTEDTIGFIEYVTNNTIQVNVDRTTTQAQYFDLGFDVYNLSNDVNYYVFFTGVSNSGVVQDVFVDVHTILGGGSGGNGGGGGGAEYNQGWGIVITNNTISVNPNIIPAAQVQSDWSQSNSGSVDYIKNKPSEIELVGGHGVEIEIVGSSAVISCSGGTGADYEAGYGISIVNDVISVTGMQQAGNYLSPSDLNGYATETYVDTAVSAVSAAIPELPQTEEVEFEELNIDDYALASSVPVIELNGDNQVTAIDGHEIYGTGGSFEQVNADWDAVSGVAEILNKPEIVEMDVKGIQGGQYVNITEGNDNIVISVTGVAAATAIPELPQTEEVEFEELDLSDYALASAIPSLAGYATEVYVQGAVSGKQNVLTGITDVQVVQSLPASPVSTVLYLIPEA